MSFQTELIRCHKNGNKKNMARRVKNISKPKEISNSYNKIERISARIELGNQRYQGFFFKIKINFFISVNFSN